MASGLYRTKVQNIKTYLHIVFFFFPYKKLTFSYFYNKHKWRTDTSRTRFLEHVVLN